MNERINSADTTGQGFANKRGAFDALDVILSNQMVSEGCPNVQDDIEREVRILRQTVVDKEAV